MVNLTWLENELLSAVFYILWIRLTFVIIINKVILHSLNHWKPVFTGGSRRWGSLMSNEVASIKYMVEGNCRGKICLVSVQTGSKESWPCNDSVATFFSGLWLVRCPESREQEEMLPALNRKTWCLDTSKENFTCIDRRINKHVNTNSWPII